MRNVTGGFALNIQTGIYLYIFINDICYGQFLMITFKR